MGYEYIYLGSAPSEEECAQVGSEGYVDRAIQECRAYINQLERILVYQGYPKEKRPEAFCLVVRSESHDFGTYIEVCARIDSFLDESGKAYDLGILLDYACPAEWDEQARAELGMIPSIN